MNSVYERKNSPFQIFMCVFAVLLIISTLLPISHVLAISLSGKNAIARGEVTFFPKDLTFEAYTKVLGNASMIYSLFYSLFLTVFSGAMSMLFTILAAYPLSKPYLRGRRFFNTLVVITMYVSAGTVPTYLIIKELHLLNTFWVLVLPGLISAFNLIILRTFFSSIDQSLFEAAYIDGCGEWKALFRIALPLSLPSVLTLSLFYMVSRWNGVTDVMYYINDPSLYTLQYQLKLMLDVVNLPYEYGVIPVLTPENIKSSTVVFAMIPMLIIYPFIQKYFTKGMMIGGVKG